MSKLNEIEGIGDVYRIKLEEAGISSIENLLKVCGDKNGRKNTAGKSGISEELILKWVNRADLTRINGVNTQYADLLEFAGVDTVPELSKRNPANLQIKMSEVNMEKKLVNKVPSIGEVESWINQAKGLPRAITY